MKWLKNLPDYWNLQGKPESNMRGKKRVIKNNWEDFETNKLIISKDFLCPTIFLYTFSDIYDHPVHKTY